jgi:NAD(P)-dependent dehydrogenase (short-subunit alcohol dehydrogenase family)
MPWTAADIPDQRRRAAVVTGANAGLGLETTQALAAAGAHVVLAVRNQDKTATAVAALREQLPRATVTVVPLDLASQNSVRDASEQILAEHRKVDILINNAGVMAIPEHRSTDGFEMQLAVNHLGHWALTARLMPALLRADAARVVTVTSAARHAGRSFRDDNPHLEGIYTPWRAYAQSKLANFHFAVGLQRVFSAAGVGVASLAAHPGISNTELGPASVRASGGGFSQQMFTAIAATIGMSPGYGALSQLRAATDPAARGGDLYAPRFVSFGTPVRRPVLPRIGLQRAITRLWEISERETGLTIDVGARTRHPRPVRSSGNAHASAGGSQA